MPCILRMADMQLEFDIALFKEEGRIAPAHLGKKTIYIDRDKQYNTFKMKTTAILFAALASASAVAAQGDQQRLLATLAEKWNLTDPSFAYDSNTFNLTFPVTDFIGTGMSNFSLWTAPGCQSDGGTSLTNDDVWSSSPRLVENSALTSGSSLDSGAFNGRSATIVAAFDPQKVSTSVIYNDTSVTGQGASAQIRFCMRFGVWTTEAMGVTTPVEVNFLETLVTLTVNLTSGFQIGAINVAPKNRLVRTANQAYEVRGYECSAGSFNELSTADKDRPRNQGEIIHDEMDVRHGWQVWTGGVKIDLRMNDSTGNRPIRPSTDSSLRLGK
ncbi:hypothetical protein G9A89_021672 [Geosiphon pyriformis]|nr:hypothetical protein G9A89_021672 [Geosiphon pyriformis]